MFIVSHFIVIIFAFFLILAGFFIFLKPEKTRETIAKAGSTYLINYTELGIRLIIGIAFINLSLFSIYELYFTIIGCFLIITAILLMLVPIKKHNQFSKKAAERLKPIYLKIAAPFSIFFGILILLAIYNQYISYANLCETL